VDTQRTSAFTEPRLAASHIMLSPLISTWDSTRFSMMRLVLVLALSFPLLGAKKPEPDWKTAKVLDSHLARSSVPVGSTTNTSGTATVTGSESSATVSGQSTSSTRVDFANIRDDQLLVLSDEFAYVVEDTRVSGGHGLVAITSHAIANRKHGCRFIVGDDVKFWQEKAVLHVIDADGKECKVDILRQERRK
jgi:hypothetical protein